MHLCDAARSLGLNVLPTAWVRHWDAFLHRYDPAALPRLMSAEIIRELSRHLTISERVHKALLDHLRLFDEHPVLNPLFQLCHRLLYEAEEHAGMGEWPLFRDKDLPGGNMFYAYLYLAGRDYAQRKRGELGIPPHLTDQTLSDISVWIEDYHAKHGHWGLEAHAWVANYVLKLRLFQLGRLQFVSHSFKLPFRGYRRRSTGELLVLAREGRRYRNDGQFDGENRRLDPDAWTASLEVTDEEIRGHRVTPDGEVLREPVVLDARDWEMVFDEGSPGLNIHIPAGPPLRAEECQASIRQAIEFFPRYFPDRPFDVIWCYSWLMDAQLKRYLPPTSGIVQFQNEFYLIPFPNTSGWQTIERTFGKMDADLSRVEAKTSLQRAVLEHVRRGGTWRCSAGVIFPRDYAPGRHPYRTDRRRAPWYAAAH